MNTLLRIEAVNLVFVIDDTEDLSTRRGGSSMLLHAIELLRESFAAQLDPISTGASVGLFALLPAAGDGQQLLREVRAFLQDPAQPHAHATFAVDLVHDSSFRQASEKALSANRWWQMQRLNFTTIWGEAEPACAIDEIRPATARDHLPAGGVRAISASVHARRQAGRELRQSLYRRILGHDPGLAFTNDTESLSSFPAGGYPDIPSNLDGKMALFYADGNRFGRFQRDCRDAAALQSWDKEIKSRRRRLLQSLLDWLAQTPWARTSDGKLRFETLLWGGDEMLFLLPAWLGLEFAEKFFSLTADWCYRDEALTHAAGLVMARHSTPISQLQKLARQLAEHGKSDAHKAHDSLSWIVLESFDHAGDQIDRYWERNGIGQDGWEQLLLDRGRLQALRDCEPLKDALPRSAMMRTLRILAMGRQQRERQLLEGTSLSCEQALSAAQRQTLQKLWQAFGATWSPLLPADDALPAWASQQAVAWSALLELWDYLLPSAPPALLPEDVA